SSKASFHSTTFQPNTVSTLHFLRCLEKDDPEFHAEIAPALFRTEVDAEVRKTLFRRLYSPSLASAIAMADCGAANVRAAGHYVPVNERRILDTVGGVACSVRGHNPSTYLQELAALGEIDCEAALTSRLGELTGLDAVLPAVSGASAVENALK